MERQTNVKNEGGKAMNKTCTVKSLLQQRVVVGRKTTWNAG